METAYTEKAFKVLATKREEHGIKGNYIFCLFCVGWETL